MCDDDIVVPWVPLLGDAREVRVQVPRDDPLRVLVRDVGERLQLENVVPRRRCHEGSSDFGGGFRLLGVFRFGAYDGGVMLCYVGSLPDDTRL